jgi:CRISPR-associated protein Cmr1
MEQLRLACEVVTPLFCAGADQQKPEIRVPSIRGAMRFWFRALMGGIMGDQLSSLRALESSIFGETERASTIALRVAERRVTRKNAGDNVGRIQTGMIYLGFPFYKWQRESKTHSLARGMIEPRSTWNLSLLLYDQNRHTPDLVMGTLWLMFLFGGLGSRSRRGFGSVRAQPVDYHGSLILQWPQNPREFLAWVHRNLQALEKSTVTWADSHGCQARQSILSGNRNQPTAFPSLSRWRAIVLADRRWTRWDQAMSDVGIFLRQFREVPRERSSSQTSHGITVTQDYRALVSQFLDGRIASEKSVLDLKHDAFGLPVQYRSSSRGGSIAILLWAMNGEEHDRRGSPLFLRPVKFNEQAYGVICLFLESQFLPEGATQVLRIVDRSWRSSNPKPQPVVIKPADMAIINEFLDAIGKRFPRLGELP